VRLDGLRAALTSALSRAEAAIGEADRTAAESATAEAEPVDPADEGGSGVAAVGDHGDRAEIVPEETGDYPSRWLV
jgi:hypothetical protein